MLLMNCIKLSNKIYQENEFIILILIIVIYVVVIETCFTCDKNSLLLYI